jgi:transcriptional regulator with XRE-family HTH domain
MTAVNYGSLGQKLRKARKKLKLSQFDVASRMECSRAQVDNIEVARQRAPLHRLEDFAKAVGLRVVVQIVPRAAKQISVRTTAENAVVLNGLSGLSGEEREMILTLVDLLPRLPVGIRGTLSGIITLWSDRYANFEAEQSESA